MSSRYGNLVGLSVQDALAQNERDNDFCPGDYWEQENYYDNGGYWSYHNISPDPGVREPYDDPTPTLAPAPTPAPARVELKPHVCTEQFDCSICLDTVYPAMGTMVERTCKTAPCGHSFCSNCIDKWTKEHDTCPMCRKSLAH